MNLSAQWERWGPNIGGNPTSHSYDGDRQEQGIELRLYGYRILLVEDEPLIGLDLAMSLEEAGAEVDGPLPTVEAALSAIDDCSSVDLWTVAFLDYRLGTMTCEPIARRLRDLSVPIVFHTGSMSAAKPIADECDASILTKPSSNTMLVDALVAATSTS